MTVAPVAAAVGHIAVETGMVVPAVVVLAGTGPGIETVFGVWLFGCWRID